MPLAQRRCQHADTNRVSQVTDRRIATGQAYTTDQASPLMSTAEHDKPPAAGKHHWKGSP